ncbi:MAG: DUF411 domain-containing protein [Alphaproteobacteria bacterium]|nr:DUF411 domain-containing protein [Alphaproteobacteria bacterium]
MRKSLRLAVVLAAAVPSLALAATTGVVHRDPGCGCCEKWVALVRQQFGRNIQMIDDARHSAYQARLGVPARLASCHTAVIDGLVFEGHVPIADMQRLLREHPRGVTGLAVAGMPMGSPGMEMPGMRGQPYDVIAFGPAGTRVYAHHGS